MATPAEILREMIDNVEPQSENLDSNIDQISLQIDALNVEIDGVQNGLCGVAESDLIAYLDGTKIPELEILYGNLELETGPTFGTIGYGTGNITDWQVIDSTTGSAVYKYLGINWDGDPYITKLISDYAFGNDYLWRPLIGSGLGSEASYGLYPTISNLGVGRGYQVQNKSKIDASIDTFTRYIN